MDNETKKLLEENLKVSQETLETVKKLRRDQWYRRLFTFIKWLAILGVLAWAFTQIQPYLEQFLGTLENIQDFSNNLPRIPGF